MKHLPSLPYPVLILAMILSNCTSPQPTAEEKAAFAPVQPVLETNCVHCHGDNRLSSMPSIHDTHALATLVGSGK